MITFIIRRILQMVLVLIGVSIIVFVIMFLVPTDAATLQAGKNQNPERVEMIRKQLGLDQPIYKQYLLVRTAPLATATSASPTSSSARSPR